MKVPDNYKSLTTIAAQYSKQLGNWTNFPVGKNAIAQFAENYPEVDNPIIIVKGRAANRGTWAHEKLAVKFLQWCNPDTVQGLLHQNIELKAEVEFQRTKIQAMLPFIPDDVIQRQIESGQSNRAIDLLRGDLDPGFNVELIANWVERQKGDPRAIPTAKRLVESPGNLKPGQTYGLAGYRRKSETFKVAFDRWDDFECLLASLEPHYNLSIEDVNEWLDRIDAVQVPVK